MHKKACIRWSKNKSQYRTDERLLHILWSSLTIAIITHPSTPHNLQIESQTQARESQFWNGLTLRANCRWEGSHLFCWLDGPCRSLNLLSCRGGLLCLKFLFGHCFGSYSQCHEWNNNRSESRNCTPSKFKNKADFKQQIHHPFLSII